MHNRIHNVHWGYSLKWYVESSYPSCPITCIINGFCTILPCSFVYRFWGCYFCTLRADRLWTFSIWRIPFWRIPIQQKHISRKGQTNALQAVVLSWRSQYSGFASRSQVNQSCLMLFYLCVYFIYVCILFYLCIEHNCPVLCVSYILQDESMQFVFKVYLYTSPCESKDLAFPWVKLHAPLLLPLLQLLQILLENGSILLLGY